MHLIKVAIADDHSIFRKGLYNALSEEPDIIVTGQAENGRQLIELVEKQSPDVIITDIAMPLMDGIEATSIISNRFPHISTIALSIFEKEEIIRKMISVGAKGYLLKNADKGEIITAIKTVHKRDVYYRNSTFSKAIYSNGSAQSQPNLTEKELMVMKLICEQYSSKEIAAKLDSSVRSVESAKERILNKVGARNIVGIAMYAVKKMIVSIKNTTDYI
jgi:two-component system, NarL family, response regulator NreC